MSDGMLDFYSKKYPASSNKFFPLVHTFKDYPPTKSSSLQKKNVYQFALFGNFNDSNIDATKALIHASRFLENVKINIYTHVPKVLLKMRGIDIDQICYKGFVSDDQFYPEIQKNDIGVVTHGFEGGYSEIEYQTIFPTRMIPQLLSGNPVIVIAPEESFLASFVKKHDCGLLITQRDPEHIAQKIQDLLNDAILKKKYIDNAQSTVKMFFGPNVVGSLKNQILQYAPT